MAYPADHMGHRNKLDHRAVKVNEAGDSETVEGRKMVFSRSIIQGNKRMPNSIQTIWKC